MDFCGSWWLGREIIDLKTGLRGYMDGMATFEPDSSSLRYIEVGRLVYAGQPQLRASRRYWWQPRPGGIDICFDNGQFFHRLDITQRTTKAEHVCAEDTYNVLYDFSEWPVWSATWHVAGPRKLYTMTSSYYAAGDIG
ncbi:DUF6314 family protein [Pseudohalocynthiibacter aestuariivivens]|uniref:DUF6314 family protein n=1 Tax=Pseudohalocynthiibacter aestuariivivens TaxID=1591409 RepID=A0ABV5JCF1_9RHOB|nr:MULTISPECIES: DUF6314 family protein [Pseudohalocynthiibacter]MBS9718588.1 trigger factor [Pseudohalocynthiibacter aestuariivivens]MCK0103600.1 DUF6314 family protein [Pseudohalocynthiibacter sp. F2068]